MQEKLQRQARIGANADTNRCKGRHEQAQRPIRIGTRRWARKDAKAGKKRRKDTQEKAQRHARKGALPDKKRRKGRQEKLQNLGRQEESQKQAGRNTSSPQSVVPKASRTSRKDRVEEKAKNKGQEGKSERKKTNAPQHLSNTFRSGLLYVTYVLLVTNKRFFERKRKPKQARPTEGKTQKPLAQKQYYQWRPPYKQYHPMQNNMSIIIFLRSASRTTLRRVREVVPLLLRQRAWDCPLSGFRRQRTPRIKTESLRLSSFWIFPLPVIFSFLPDFRSVLHGFCHIPVML